MIGRLYFLKWKWNVHTNLNIWMNGAQYPDFKWHVTRIWHSSILIYVANLELRTVKVPKVARLESIFLGALYPWSSSTWTGRWMEDGNVFISSLRTTNKLWCAQSYFSNNTVQYTILTKNKLSKVVGRLTAFRSRFIRKYAGYSHNHSIRLLLHNVFISWWVGTRGTTNSSSMQADIHLCQSRLILTS